MIAIKEDFDNELLIEAVRKRPELYNKDESGYADKYGKRKQWFAVCAEVLSNWDNVKSSDKIQLSLRMQRKWKNIRDCFRRDLQLQKQLRQPKKRKRYLYHDQLRFLIPHTLDRKDSDDSYYCTTTDNEFEEGETDQKVTVESETIYIQGFPEEKKSDASTMTEIETSSNTEDATRKTENVEDRLFLLSLVPTFEKLTDEQKLTVKVDFLTILQKTMYSNTQ